MYLQKLPHALNGSAILTTAEWILPITYHVCQQGQLRCQGESGGGAAPPPCARPCNYKIVKKWSENASREVKKSKIFLPEILPPAPPPQKTCILYILKLLKYIYTSKYAYFMKTCIKEDQYFKANLIVDLQDILIYT